MLQLIVCDWGTARPGGGVYIHTHTHTPSPAPTPVPLSMVSPTSPIEDPPPTMDNYFPTSVHGLPRFSYRRSALDHGQLLSYLKSKNARFTAAPGAGPRACRVSTIASVDK